MNHLSRPYKNIYRWGPLALAATALCITAAGKAHAQAERVTDFFANPFPSLAHASQGYLGVEIEDIDQERAQQLKLKDVRGAVITLIDHDAPAGKIGLKVNDVVISINGQQVEGAEQFKRMLREIPSGRKVSLEISRDGNIQTMAVELADRAAMEHDVWDKMDKEDGDLLSPVSGMGILGANGDVTGSTGFHMPFVGSSLTKVGALVEPLTSQMAAALGVDGGLMVKQVAHKSEAANAGLRAFDVILKVGSDPINTSADWERALRSNQGKQVQVTILREKKQQTLNLQVDSKHHSELEWMDVFGDSDPELVAENDLSFPEMFSSLSDSEAAEQLQEQAQKSLDSFATQVPHISEQQSEELRKQAEQIAQDAAKFGEQFKEGQFGIDQKQMDELKQQMQQFKVDPKQMEELKQQMEQFRNSFNADQFKQQFELNQKQMDELKQQMQQFKVDPKQMEELRRQMNDWNKQLQDQMEYWREQQSGHFV